MKTFLIVFAGILPMTTIAVSEGAQIREIVAEGSGCPHGSVVITKGPDDSSFSLVFDQFVAEPARVEAQRKSCTVLAKVEVAQGYSVAVRPATFGIEHTFSSSSLGRLAIDVAFAGRRASVNMNLGRDGYSSVRTGELGWSNCGAEVDLRFAIKLDVKKGSARDVARAAVLHSQPIELAWRRCP